MSHIIDIAKGEFLTPLLRLLQGDAFEPQTTDMDGKPLIGDDGKPYVKFFIAAGGRKGDPLVEAFKKQIEDRARSEWPALFPGGGACTNPNFSYKVIDGDGYDMNGKHNATKEGFAGHWVFRFSTGFRPECYNLGAYNKMTDQLHCPPGGLNPIPRGYYIRVHGWIKSNRKVTKPGMALYQDLIELNPSQPTDIIVSGPDAGAVFGGGMPAPMAAPVMAPPPVAAMAPPPVAVSYQVSAALAAQGHTMESLRASGTTEAVMLAQGWIVAAAPVAAPVMAPPPVMVAPHPNILAPTGSVAPPPAPVVAPPVLIAAAAPGFKMSNPAGPTYKQYIDGGWTDAALIANQHMVPA